MHEPSTDDGSPAKAGMRVEASTFLVVGAAIFVAFLVYWLVAREPAGMVMLLLTAAMMGFLGGYVLLQHRRSVDPAATGPAGGGDHYLPHASLWPFAVGVGAVLIGNGLALGAWAVAPGAALVAYGLWGYARQSRRRD